MPKSSSLELYMTLEEAVTLEVALDAFDQITAGSSPDKYELAAAPRLTEWRRTLVPVTEPVLIGRVEGHPRLPGRRQVITSRLLALDIEAGWARTTSRYYRLAPPFD